MPSFPQTPSYVASTRVIGLTLAVFCHQRKGSTRECDARSQVRALGADVPEIVTGPDGQIA
eukprot:4779699-Pleurochrysis_carterae.AAC.1